MSAALQRIEQRVPGFLAAGWRGRTGRSGDALLHVLAHFADLVEDAVRLAPDKDLLAFLDAMGVTLLPALAARAPVVFSLGPRTATDVNLPLDTQLAAMLPPLLPSSIGGTAATNTSVAGTPVVFSTDRAIALVRADLAAVHSLLPAQDRLADHTQSVTSGFEFFPLSSALSPPDLVVHELYLGHDTLLALPPDATVTLLVSVADTTAASVTVTWEHYTKSGWIAFVPGTDQTSGLTTDGAIVLSKLASSPSAASTIGSINSFWIRARTVRELLPPGADTEAIRLPSLETVRVSVSHGQRGLGLNSAFANNLPLDTSKDFAPFGPQPAVGSALTLACDAAFGQQGAQLELEFTASSANLYPPTPPPPPAANTGAVLAWEYSSGPGLWTALHFTEQIAAGQGGPWTTPAPSYTEQFAKGKDWRRIVFYRPADWVQTALNGQRHYWLRVRLAAGAYGSPPSFPGGVATGGYTPPILASMTAGYAIEAGPEPPDHAIVHNRFDWQDVSEAARWGRAPFQPFQSVPDTVPALYFGFTQPLPIGLVSLLADGPTLTESLATPGASPFTWEYRTLTGWSELAVLDETGGFSQTGMVQFIGPPDLSSDAGPDGPLYWIRARLKAGSGEPSPLALEGLYLNAVWATNRTTVTGEIVGLSDGSPALTLGLQHPLVLPGQRVEVQEWSGTGESWRSLLDDVPGGDLREQTGADGQVTAVWVTWHERPNLYSSGPRDRHYVIARTHGTISFGDGSGGMIPPPGAPIAASYQYGGGRTGNVPVGTITQLRSAIPSVSSVTNPLPASGGSDAEAVPSLDTVTAAMFAPPAGTWRDGIRARGPQQLRHRGRSLAPFDYEWLARDASTEVAFARCLPATGPDGPQAGWVTVIVAPVGSDAKPQPSLGLLDTVRQQLSERAPATIATQIRVTGPAYEPISVLAEIVVGEVDLAAAIEQNLRSALDTYLHPILGGGERGWQFGDTVHRSAIARVIDAVPGVDRTTSLQLSTGGFVSGDAIPLTDEHLPCSGRHTLLLKAGS